MTLAEHSWPMLAATVVLTATLLALTIIDLRVRRLPDWLTLPLLLLGLAQATWLEPDQLTDRAIGATCGYLAFALIAWLYRRTRGRDGLGMGDAKLLAAGGAWLGWSLLPAVVAGAAVTALAFALIRARGRIDATAALAFGPPLSLAIWIAWLWRLATSPVQG